MPSLCGVARPLIDVSRTFQENEILITGANGFVGKVALAMLLERYPSATRVHILVRARRGTSAQERFEQEVLASPVFAAFGREAMAKRIVVHEGDAAELGDEAAQAMANVRLIIHCAGLVEFFAPVDEALRANVDALEKIADLAVLINAKLLHISTCYVAGRCDGLVEENQKIDGFYPLRTSDDDHTFDAQAEVQRLRERIADLTTGERNKATIQALTELGRSRAERWGWVNTYTYSKSLGEQMLAQRTDLDWAIVRPAIVESALEFPFPGWVEGGRTAAPLVLMALSGMTEWPARADLSLEVVPVDQIAAAMLAVGALLLEGQARPVYQLAGSDQNPFTMGSLIALLAAEAKKRGAATSGEAKLYDGEDYLQRNRSQRAQVETMEQRLGRLGKWLKSKGLPGAASATRRSGQMRQAALQLRFREQTVEQYLPFTSQNRYLFEAKCIRQAIAQLSDEDRKLLPWTPESIDWPSYWRDNEIEGVLKWVQPDAVRDWSFQL
jgi:long-chain acyl-CoA synthetase